VKRAYRIIVHKDRETHMHSPFRIDQVLDDADLDALDPVNGPLKLLFGVLE
jgi:hypothetical protein